MVLKGFKDRQAKLTETERNREGIEKLKNVANFFYTQDSRNFITLDQLLDSFKQVNGNYFVSSDGIIYSDYNKDRINATIEDALLNVDKTYYIEEEKFIKIRNIIKFILIILCN